jgi:toxin ParE1/3/4
MPCAVLLTDHAARDLEELYKYIGQHDLPGNADHVLDRIEQALTGLTQSPERGTFPKELLALGIREYREIFFKPYRIIYRVVEHNVYVLLIADGRRDLNTLLQQRLLEA